MATARSPRPTSSAKDAPAKVRRSKVMTTKMDAAKPARKTKRAVVKRPAKTKPITKPIVESEPSAAIASELPDLADAPELPKLSEWNGRDEPRPARRSAVERLNDPPPADGPLLIARVANAIERELTQIELIIGNNRVPLRARSEAERRARTLASLARTLAIVTQLRDKSLQGVADDDDDEAMPTDLDTFRETLARRLEKLIADQPPSADGEPEPG